MKLKGISTNIAVHVSTEAEKKELFAILNQNDFRWGDAHLTMSPGSQSDEIYLLTPERCVFSSAYRFKDMTFAEFKRIYCEDTETTRQMESQWRSVEETIDSEKWLRMKLIIAFGGDVTKATTALEFVNGNPEASEQYCHFKEWEMENHRDYCQSKGIRLVKPTSSEEQ